ncbi:hypothetical protein DZG01_09480 [Pseudomonas fluorescens]|nr:hypothetical protein DZG01_09480 [Pseudomonas fluorescens]
MFFISMSWSYGGDAGEGTCFNTETRGMVTNRSPTVPGLWIQAFGRVFRKLDSLDGNLVKRRWIRVWSDCVVSRMKQITQ